MSQKDWKWFKNAFFSRSRNPNREGGKSIVRNILFKMSQNRMSSFNRPRRTHDESERLFRREGTPLSMRPLDLSKETDSGLAAWAELCSDLVHGDMPAPSILSRGRRLAKVMGKARILHASKLIPHFDFSHLFSQAQTGFRFLHQASNHFLVISYNLDPFNEFPLQMSSVIPITLASCLRFWFISVLSRLECTFEISDWPSGVLCRCNRLSRSISPNLSPAPEVKAQKNWLKLACMLQTHAHFHAQRKRESRIAQRIGRPNKHPSSKASRHKIFRRISVGNTLRQQCHSDRLRCCSAQSHRYRTKPSSQSPILTESNPDTL